MKTPKIKTPDSDKCRVNMVASLKHLTLPGFTREDGEGRADLHQTWTREQLKRFGGKDTSIFVRFKSEEQGIVIILNTNTVVTSKYGIADGHVFWTDPLDKGWRSYDQTGVEDSFYLDYDNLTKAQQILNEQLARVAESRKRSLEAGPLIAVPGTGFRISQARKDQMMKALQGGIGQSLTPSGFGTGVQIWVNRAPAYAKRREDLEKFFGVTDRLFTTDMDCD